MDNSDVVGSLDFGNSDAGQNLPEFVYVVDMVAAVADMVVGSDVPLALQLTLVVVGVLLALDVALYFFQFFGKQHICKAKMERNRIKIRQKNDFE